MVNVNILHFLLGLSALPALLVAAASDGQATVALYESAKRSSAPGVSYSDCGASAPSVSVHFPVDTCLWGDYYLVNNFKITQYPRCRNGKPPVALFYATTSCTGNPTFRSDSLGGAAAVGAREISDRCLFGSSPRQWSMVFRCSGANSQMISTGRYQQAIPPAYDASRRNQPAPSGGVVTRYHSFDCTINRPKPPTFLDADVCLKLGAGRSLHVAQPVVCGNGKAAKGVIYSDDECAEWNGFIGNDIYSDGYYASIDKKCHSVNARSFQFSCGGGGNKSRFEDLPPHEHKEVEPLRLFDRPVKPEPEPEIPTPDPAPPSTGRDGGFLVRRQFSCSKRPDDLAVTVKADTCLRTFDNRTIIVQTPAHCGNGTKALFATYTGTDCQSQDLDSLRVTSPNKCYSARRVGSFAFWCDGVSRQPGGSGTPPHGGVSVWITVLFALSMVLLFSTAVITLGFMVKGAAMMKLLGALAGKFKALFRRRRREGRIRLEDDDHTEAQTETAGDDHGEVQT
ncbi:hypothetical protein F4778DRAFT_752895 [Xylariomycetidae sp. FL2044]|nr:hypothetical protein F4778DRAFT_752895 [Xylariomycetidae sp. FL2044]